MKKRIWNSIQFLVRLGAHISPARCIVLAFGMIILVGAALLMLPCASADRISCSPLTAVFTAVSATCVTGLSLVETGVAWSGFGQIVILVLIQLGGLGFMSILSIFFFMLHSKIGLKKRMILAQAFSLNSVDGVVKLVRHVLFGTLTIELAGAALLTVRFLGRFPWLQALKMGIFHSVSAFCNAGFDLLGCIQPGSSLALYAGDVWVNLVIMALIIIGGIGFFVWEDLLRYRFRFKRLTVYSRLVLVTTTILILGGWLLFALLEWNNPETLGAMPAGQRVLAALFQSVTTRTAGFATVPQGALLESSKAISTLLMFIGGSSGSTAGGLKTVTVAVLVLASHAMLRGRRQVRAFHRGIAQQQILQALSLFACFFALMFGGAVILTASSGFSFLDCLYEATSALATVGLSTGLTGALPAAGKILLIIYMFLGRVGIVTVGMGLLLGSGQEELYRTAETKLLIG